MLLPLFAHIQKNTEVWQDEVMEYWKGFLPGSNPLCVVCYSTLLVLSLYFLSPILSATAHNSGLETDELITLALLLPVMLL